MPLSEATQDVDTFDILAKKVEAVSALNRDTLETIESLMNEEVVIGHDYTLQYNVLGEDAKVDEEKQLMFRSVPRKKNIKDVVAEWRNERKERLEKEPIFGDAVNLSVYNFEHLRRVTKNMQDFGDKYVEHMRDGPKVRKGLRIVLNNMEMLQVFLGEIHSKILNVEDSISNSTELSHEVTQMTTAFKNIQKIMPTMKFNLNARYQSGLRDEVKRIVVKGAGLYEVNGIYKEERHFFSFEDHQVHYVQRNGIQFTPFVYCIFWTKEKWGIAALKIDTFGEPCSLATQNVLYTVNVKGKSSKMPPFGGWVATKPPYRPTPTVSAQAIQQNQSTTNIVDKDESKADHVLSYLKANWKN